MKLSFLCVMKIRFIYLLKGSYIGGRKKIISNITTARIVIVVHICYKKWL